MNFRFESVLAIVASSITLLYIVFPGPYLMGLFVFVAQPLFLILFAAITIRIIGELRQRGIL